MVGRIGGSGREGGSEGDIKRVSKKNKKKNNKKKKKKKLIKKKK